MTLSDLPACEFAQVMNYPEDPEAFHVFDFTRGYDPEAVRKRAWGIGRYDEKRRGMYVAPQYKNERNIHMGIDIWAGAGEPVFSFCEGELVYMRDNDQPGNYGPTLVVKYLRKDTGDFYALYGHLSRGSLYPLSVGQKIRKGEKIGELGDERENGGWVPHLHFQLATDDPGEADMPGVVSEGDREAALVAYPDPRLVLGPLY